MESEPGQIDEADETRQEQNESKRRIIDVLSRNMQWSDEIPEQILHGHGEYKVRINWWSIITGQIYLALIFNFINNPSVKEECKKFLGKYAGTDYWKSCTNRTTREDLDHANRVVTMVIQDLESTI